MKQSIKNLCFFAMAAGCAGLSVNALAQASKPSTANGAPVLSSPIGGAAAVQGANPATHAAALQTLPELPGTTSWKLLGQAKAEPKGKVWVNVFPPNVQVLSKKDVKIYGFMMPLGPAEMQSHFLLTATPQTCTFCVPAGPEQMIEVKTAAPIKITFDPILVSGRFEVLNDDPNGMMYRITSARQASPLQLPNK